MMKLGDIKEDRYTTSTVAKRAGVHRDTLLRWLRKGLIPEPGRDRRGWRVFSKEEMEAIAEYSQNIELLVKEQKTLYDVGSRFEIERLQMLDWDFNDAKTDYLTHGIHPYPAKFIPQIPNALIQELSSVGDTVVDIFCGSGTTLVEALLLKRNAIGIDANPLACLISQAKTTLFQNGDVETLENIVIKSDELANSISINRVGSLFENEPFTSLAAKPTWNKLHFWFKSFVIEELAELLYWCNRIESRSARQVALTALSSIIVAVSKQDSDTRYVRREKNIFSGETLRRFSKSLSDAIQSVSEFSDVVEPRFYCSVIHANLLNKPDIPMADLVVCSPPYPNAYSYHLYHMTRMIWLDMDQPSFKRDEIGSHRKYSRKGKNGATIDTFREEMETVFDWLRGVLHKGKYACFVVGDSTIRGLKINNADLLSTAAQKNGFVEIARVKRRIQATKKAFNPIIGKIKDEKILILQNGG